MNLNKNINEITLSGNLATKPVYKNLDGTFKMSFNIIVNQNDKNIKHKFKIIALGKNAEIYKKRFEIGDYILVKGSLQIYTYLNHKEILCKEPEIIINQMFKGYQKPLDINQNYYEHKPIRSIAN